VRQEHFIDRLPQTGAGFGMHLEDLVITHIVLPFL
jgi:hypothetical protein